MKTNEKLRDDVLDEIKWEPELRNVATEIGVTAKDGVVTLSGYVDTYWKKLAAEKAAQRVSGVKVVACDIEVRVAKFLQKNDTEIAETVKNALRWNSAVNEDDIEVKVDNGWVYLEGKVDWDFERISAQRNVENLIGVKGVTNNISLKAKPIDAKVIKNNIAAAFHRNATIDASTIRVESAGGKVTLRGKVKSWGERKEAENVAWATQGVVSVDNKIEIDIAVYA